MTKTLSVATEAALIERLKQATGPDRELDRDIHSAMCPDHAGEAPEYTRSFAAALSLIEDPTARNVCIVAIKARSSASAHADLVKALDKFLAAEDAVEGEAARAEMNGGKGWSSGPTVQRIYALRDLRAARSKAQGGD